MDEEARVVSRDVYVVIDSVSCGVVGPMRTVRSRSKLKVCFFIRNRTISS